MKQNPDYLLTRLAGVPYLLPYGQMIADFRHGIKINETGVFLWNLLEKEYSAEKIITLAKEHYQIAENDYPSFEQEIKEFLHILKVQGIISDDSFEKKDTGTLYLNIAGLTCQLIHFEQVLPNEIKEFVTSSAIFVHQKITLHVGKPHILEHGTLILQNEQLQIIKLTHEYILHLPQAEGIDEIHISVDGTQVDFYVMPPFTKAFQDSLFHALRIPFLYLAQNHGMVALHSSSILYKEKAWLFAAPSGTGKSTHADLWNKLFQTSIINGDVNLLALQKKHPVIHGLPWCGTSGIYDTKTYPLGGIILLKQASKDHVVFLTEDEKQLLVSQRLITPAWNKKQFKNTLSYVEKITHDIFICQLHCTPNPSAVETIKDEIDRYLNDF